MRRLMGYTRPYKRTFIGDIVAAALLAGMNVLLHKILQVYLDRYLDNTSDTVLILLLFAVLYAFGTLVKAVLLFYSTFLLHMGAERGLEDARRTLFE